MVVKPGNEIITTNGHNNGNGHGAPNFGGYGSSNGHGPYDGGGAHPSQGGYGQGYGHHQGGPAYQQHAHGGHFDAHGVAGAYQPHGGESTNDGWRKLHRLLSGRYKKVAFVAMMVSGFLFCCGYVSGGHEFVSPALIQCSPTVVTLDTPGVDQALPQVVFDAFVDSQVAILKDHKVLDAAVLRPEWTSVTPDFKPAMMIGFSNSLEVERRNAMISVKFTASTSKKAAGGTRAVLAAYQEMFLNDDAKTGGRKLKVLTEKQRDLIDQDKAIRTAINELAVKSGSENVESAYASKVELMKKLDQDIQAHRIALSTAFGVAREKEQASVDGLSKLREDLRNEIKVLGADRLAVQDLYKKLDAVTVASNDVRKRIEQINADAQLSSQIIIASPPEEPLFAAKNTRVKNAAIGGIAGFVLAVGAMLLLAIVDPRLRTPMDLHRVPQPVPVIGVLPEVEGEADFSSMGRPGGASAGDPEQVERIAHCVHHVRAMLQISSDGRSGTVLGITGPAAGSGKTTLSLALGISYASSGARVLLIDADLAGGGLSGRVDATAKPRLGQMLLKCGWLTEEQLGVAVEQRVKSIKPLGEVLVDLQYITEDQLQEALDYQRGRRLGLIEAIRGEPLNECICATGISNLAVLTLGNATPGQASHLSPQAIRTLLNRVRPQFDVVLVDTGPVLGSLEAAVIAPEVDGMILTVSKGDHRNLVSRSIDRLHTLNAHVVGIVFNRANKGDVLVEEQSLRHNGRREDGAGLGLALAPDMDLPVESERFGPVARAVVSSAPTMVSRAG